MISVDEIACLFKGDRLSLGYAHEELIVELCSRCAKGVDPTSDWVKRILYTDEEDISAEAGKIIADGVRLWYRRGRPRKSPG